VTLRGICVVNKYAQISVKHRRVVRKVGGVDQVVSEVQGYKDLWSDIVKYVFWYRIRVRDTVVRDRTR
jgi:hypothetical protein